MSADAVHGHGTSNTRLYTLIWIYLLILTGVEVVLAYAHIFSTMGMLVALMLLSLVKAAMIIAYFMHLKFERMSLILSLIPSVVIVIALLFVFFPDGFRALELRVQ